MHSRNSRTTFVLGWRDLGVPLSTRAGRREMAPQRGSYTQKKRQSCNDKGSWEHRSMHGAISTPRVARVHADRPSDQNTRSRPPEPTPRHPECIRVVLVRRGRQSIRYRPIRLGAPRARSGARTRSIEVNGGQSDLGSLLPESSSSLVEHRPDLRFERGVLG